LQTKIFSELLVLTLNLTTELLALLFKNKPKIFDSVTFFEAFEDTWVFELLVHATETKQLEATANKPACFPKPQLCLQNREMRK